jgi:ribosomal protein S18 acetylase RimI-like enzyme
MQTQPAAPADAAAIMRILTLCVEHMRLHGIEQWDDVYPNLETVERDALSQSLFVARENGICVGSISLNEEQPVEYAPLSWSHVDGRALIVHRLCVHPEWQQRGVGRHLMNFAEGFAKRHGYVCIRLDAYTGNRRALALYERRDIEESGKRMFRDGRCPSIVLKCASLENFHGKIDRPTIVGIEQ